MEVGVDDLHRRPRPAGAATTASNRSRQSSSAARSPPARPRAGRRRRAPRATSGSTPPAGSVAEQRPQPARSCCRSHRWVRRAPGWREPAQRDVEPGQGGADVPPQRRGRRSPAPSRSPSSQDVIRTSRAGRLARAPGQHLGPPVERGDDPLHRQLAARPTARCSRMAVCSETPAGRGRRAASADADPQQPRRSRRRPTSRNTSSCSAASRCALPANAVVRARDLLGLQPVTRETATTPTSYARRRSSSVDNDWPGVSG